VAGINQPVEEIGAEAFVRPTAGTKIIRIGDGRAQDVGEVLARRWSDRSRVF